MAGAGNTLIQGPVHAAKSVTWTMCAEAVRVMVEDENPLIVRQLVLEPRTIHICAAAAAAITKWSWWVWRPAPTWQGRIACAATADWQVCRLWRRPALTTAWRFCGWWKRGWIDHWWLLHTMWASMPTSRWIAPTFVATIVF